MTFSHHERTEKMKRRFLSIICLLLALCLLVSCGKKAETVEPAPEPENTVTTTATADVMPATPSASVSSGATPSASASSSAVPSAVASYEDIAVGAAAEAPMGVYSKAESAVDGYMPEPGVTAITDGDIIISDPIVIDPVSPPNIQSGILTSGEWKDLDHLDFWAGLLENQDWDAFEASRGIYTEDYYTVKVVSDGMPVANASVSLIGGGETIAQGVTDIAGKVVLFHGIKGYESGPNGKSAVRPDSVVVGGTSYALTDFENNEITVDADLDPASDVCLDLCFLIDTTGSMGDEMEYIKKELESIVKAVAGKDIYVRTSVNFYKDTGDEYVVRNNEFKDDAAECVELIAAERADGGGDFPEAVHTALRSVLDLDWSAESVKLCFLVLDAPPHSEYEIQGINAHLRETLSSMSAEGIRVIPVAASGIDKESEFTFRSFAMITGGTYIFLTDDSGVGGSHLEPTIGDYEVELLKNCIIRVISEYCGIDSYVQ